MLEFLPFYPFLDRLTKNKNNKLFLYAVPIQHVFPNISELVKRLNWGLTENQNKYQATFLCPIISIDMLDVSGACRIIYFRFLDRKCFTAIHSARTNLMHMELMKLFIKMNIVEESPSPTNKNVLNWYKNLLSHYETTHYFLFWLSYCAISAS